MAPEIFLSITNLQLEESDFALLAVLIVAVSMIAAYVHKLHKDLKRNKLLLDEQARFNKKLNQTIEHILKIDNDGSIDSNRRQKTNIR